MSIFCFYLPNIYQLNAVLKTPNIKLKKINNKYFYTKSAIAFHDTKNSDNFQPNWDEITCYFKKIYLEE